MKSILTIVVLILFLGNKQICDLFYPGNTQDAVMGWWKLRTNIYAIIVALSFQIGLIKERNSLVRFVLNIGTGLAFSNVVDRWLFDVREYRKEDFLMIALTLGYAIYDYKCHKRN